MTKEELIEFLKESLELKAKTLTNYEGKVVSVDLEVWLGNEYITDCWIGDLS